ncbi:hypothetical protein ACIGFK_26595 [Streptomyces sp. NPDC085524]|uniref:TRAFAC clade GTPase domain-containing protein n=1 Tax=unclassified Streptomyces TaxID=2593676 RepID=UPI0035DCB48D
MNTGIVIRSLLYGTGIVAVGVCLSYGLWQFLGLALGAAGRAFGPRERLTPDQRVVPYPGSEPAHRAYWAFQMWRDCGDAALFAARTVHYLLSRHWLGKVVRDRLLQGRSGRTGMRSDSGFGRTLRRLLAPGTALAAVLSAVLASALLLCIAAVFAVQLALVALAAVAAVAAGRVAERVWKLARGVRMKCPYPRCYRPFALAVHLCPGCGAAHRALRPGGFGAWRHVCRCGRALPTTVFTGRRRLTAHCPHCDRPLPPAVGTTRVVHLPLVGGTSAGKTMLMAAVLEGLRSWSHQSSLKVEFASPEDLREANVLGRQLKDSGWTLKTQGGQPRALMLLVGRGFRRRLLYLYDPMGESLRDAVNTRLQGYLAHADGILFVADVLASPVVRRSLRAGDPGLAAAARPADLGPVETYAVLAGELQGLSGRRGRLAVATVVTKRDTLDRLTTLPRPAEPVDDWLRGIGLDDLVRSIGHDFAAARYWTVSARAATGAGALGSEQLRAAEPVLWLLARSGLRVGSLAAARPAAGGPGAHGPAPGRIASEGSKTP